MVTECLDLIWSKASWCSGSHMKAAFFFRRDCNGVVRADKFGWKLLS